MSPTRRQLLRGLGSLVAIPALPSLGLASQATPRRLVWLMWDNGAPMQAFRPIDVGAQWALHGCLEPMRPHLDQLSVISGVNNLPAAVWQGGGHAESYAAWLTCKALQPSRDLRNDISVDQAAVSLVGSGSLLPSLQVGLERATVQGACQGGFPCAYEVSISWAGPGRPLPPVFSASALFDRLFPSRVLPGVRDRKRSVLDLVMDDAARLRARAGRSDRERLDAWLDGVRHVERRLSARQGVCEPPESGGAGGVGEDETDLVFDLISRALACDVVRVVSVTLGRAASERVVPEVAPWIDHHAASHYNTTATSEEAWFGYTTWCVEQAARLTAHLADQPLDGGVLLDHTLMFAGSNMSYGPYHTVTDLPLFAVGGGGGLHRPGQHLRLGGRPLADVWLGLLHELGSDRARFGEDGRDPVRLR